LLGPSEFSDHTIASPGVSSEDQPLLEFAARLKPSL
jgi:hypothetical protein